MLDEQVRELIGQTVVVGYDYFRRRVFLQGECKGHITLGRGMQRIRYSTAEFTFDENGSDTAWYIHCDQVGPHTLILAENIFGAAE